MLTRLMAHAGWLTVTVLLCACGDGGDTTGPTPIDQPASMRPGGLAIVSGEDGTAVKGAEVGIDGHVFLSDAGGFVPLTSSTAQVVVRATGYLLRETSVPADGRVTMWPDRPGMEAHLTRELMYGHGRLIHSPARLTLVLTDSDPETWSAHEAAASLATAMGTPVVVVRQAPAGATGVVRVSINPAEAFFVENPQSWAVARMSFMGSTAAGGEIAYRHLTAARAASLVLHEIGHHFGLMHSSRPGIMNGSALHGQDFSPEEKLLMTLGRQRRPGTLFPDNDRGLAASGQGAAVVACAQGGRLPTE